MSHCLTGLCVTPGDCGCECEPCFKARSTRRFTGGGTRNCIPEPDAKDREIASLRSEVARLRHALAESAAAMREANERADRAVDEGARHRLRFYAAVAELGETERSLSLAMTEGLRAMEEMRDYADHKHWCGALGWSTASGRNHVACTCGFAALANYEEG